MSVGKKENKPSCVDVWEEVGEPVLHKIWWGSPEDEEKEEEHAEEQSQYFKKLLIDEQNSRQ